MRGLFILVLICLLGFPCRADALVQKSERVKKEDQLCFALKGKNYKKILDITEELLKETPEEKRLLVLALENAMALKAWNKALCYSGKLLGLEPNSPGLLKNQGDLYVASKDLPNAIKSYEKLVESYPLIEYKLILANLYLQNQDFVYAQVTIEPVYNINPDDTQVAQTYLKSLVAQKKIRQAYWVVKSNHLEDTLEGNLVLGDMAMMDKDYKSATNNYKNAIALNPDNLVLKDRLAQADSMLKNISDPDILYHDVEKNPLGLETELGFQYMDMVKSSTEKNRVIFNDLLSENPNYVPTRTGLVRYFLGTSNDMSILEELKKMPQNDKTKVLKAQAYFNMNMVSDAKEALRGVKTKEADALRYTIRREEALTFIPNYSFFAQQLADEFDLDIQEFGTIISKRTTGNKKIFMDYDVYVYTSGGHVLTNVTHEFIGGVRARPTEKWEYTAYIGTKVFEFGDGAMIVTDSWLKHYFNDKFNIKVGFRRDNVEQSYLSAVGRMFNGVFTGRAADNKFYLEFDKRLPHGFYLFGFGAYGVVTAQNLPTNQYGEGLVGLGKLVYYNPNHKWINSVGVDLSTYNAAYQYNLLKLYDRAGALFGGYFSPSFYNATTLNVKLDGEIKKWRLRYGISGFGGIQTGMSQDFTIPSWGVSPYVSYTINDNVTVNAAYIHYVYADIQRDQFIVNAVIRGFNKRRANKS